jgi:hypothetical protein
MKAAPDKTFFFQTKVQYLGHNISKEGVSPIQSRINAIIALKSPENKVDMMKINGALNFYSRFVNAALYPICKPFFELIRDDSVWIWTPELEKLLREVLAMFSEETVRAIPNPKYPFSIHSDASNIGIGCILIQDLSEGKKIVSFNSRCFTPDEQKLPTITRELIGVSWSLEIYEPYIIGTPFTVYLYTDHKPILYLWSKKGQLNHRTYKMMQRMTNHPNLKIVHTPGKNLVVPDILSRNFTNAQFLQEQMKHKVIPKNVSFVDEQGNEISYFIEHQIKEPTDDPFDSYPIIRIHGNEQKKFQIIGKGAIWTELKMKPCDKIKYENILAINLIAISPAIKTHFIQMQNEGYKSTTKTCNVITEGI